MKHNSILPAIAGIIIGAGATYFLLSPNSHDSMAGMDHSAMSDVPHAKTFGEANAKMHADMNIMYSNSADHDFAKGMIPHHQGAIDMAKVELEFGTDPDMRAFAQAVIDAQAPEIKFMQSWLEAHPQ